MKSKIMLLQIIRQAGKIESRTRFQKYVYLLKQKGLPLDFDFELSYYGLHSPHLSSALSVLGVKGLIKREEVEIKTEDKGVITRYDYTLSEEGQELIDSIDISDEHKEAIDDVLRKYESMSIDELLGVIYKKLGLKEGDGQG